MLYRRLVLGLIALTLGQLCAAVAPPSYKPWPDLPFRSSGRDIMSASGRKIVYAGANWPGAADTMLPEGIQHQSIQTIVGKLKSVGMNVIRLTYAIEMIDDVYAHNPNQTLAKTLVHALGQKNGTMILKQILHHNPNLNPNMTRIDVFEAVADECARQQIWVHLDNHVSKAIWCCNTGDGNSWFGDTYFDVANWQRGLGYMAKRAKSWKALASMSLRNEPREVDENPNPPAEPYTWETYYKDAIPAANAIHGNNSDVLIFFSGKGFDTDDTALVNKTTLANGHNFDPKQFSFSNKVVYEIHNYNSGVTTCEQLWDPLYTSVYGAMNMSDPNYYHRPVVMTEFGYDQTDGSYLTEYAQCLKSGLPALPGGPGGWIQWVLAGSYIIREGVQGFNETWGLLNDDWSDWRNKTVMDQYVKPFIKATLR